MSGSLVSVAVAGDGIRSPFTAVQWQELEQQALVYKYLMAGLPVPPELVVTIQRSLEALSARFFQHSPCKTRKKLLKLCYHVKICSVLGGVWFMINEAG